MGEQAAALVTPVAPGLLRRSLRAPARFAPYLLSVGSLSLAVLVVVGAESVARWCAPDYLVRTRGFHVFSDTYGWVP